MIPTLIVPIRVYPESPYQVPQRLGRGFPNDLLVWQPTLELQATDANRRRQAVAATMAMTESEAVRTIPCAPPSTKP